MNIRSLNTHQERKEARKCRRVFVEQVSRESAHPERKPNPKKNKDARRKRPEQGHRGRYKSQALPPWRPKPERIRIRNHAKLLSLQLSLGLGPAEFLALCEQRLTEEEYEWVLNTLGMSRGDVSALTQDKETTPDTTEMEDGQETQKTQINSSQEDKSTKSAE